MSSFNPKSKSDRVLIVDFNHMAHNFSYGGVRLTRTMKVGGVVQTIDTTIANGTIKNIFNWSNGGRIPTVVCFDRPCPSRKAYFMQQENSAGVDGEYKGKRESMSNSMFDGISRAQELLERGGVTCLALHNWEADDLVFLAVNKAKEQYPNHYIDVVTNDADMLPLVDEQVSVFFRSKKFTWAESKDLEKSKYIQVTPSNFSEVVEGLTSFKGLTVPYNSLLLYKVLRGDVADGLTSPFAKGVMSPRRLSDIIWQMKDGLLKEGYKFSYPKGKNVPNGITHIQSKATWLFEDDIEDDIHGISKDCYVLNNEGKRITVDLANLFKYTVPTRKYVNTNTGKEISQEEAKSIGRAGGADLLYVDNVLVDKMESTLVRFGLTKEEASIFRRQYRGMNLAQPFPDLPKDIRRTALSLGDIKGFNGTTLNSVVSVLGIHLNSRYF